jgi:hypothetical protein
VEAYKTKRYFTPFHPDHVDARSVNGAAMAAVASERVRPKDFILRLSP